MKKKPEEATWTFEMMRTNITEGELAIIKFDFLDMQVNISYTVLHMFMQLLFWVGNHGNHQNAPLKKFFNSTNSQKIFFKNFMYWSLGE